ncbi:MAG: hypothetical protein BAJALOKI1v1_450026 [Promethearchaeota archaeon]|nr:MAG: hypothetical protein BAJALOKI1v1_450026 [Candidatus Lokiarchaeota archaeon]
MYGLKRPNSKVQNLVHYTNNKRTFSENEKNEFLGHTIKLPTN